MENTLLRSVARGLKYRPLGHLVGRKILVHDFGCIEDAVRLGLGSDLPADSHLILDDLMCREGAAAKYGILDLSFTVSPGLINGEVRSGIPLLRELKFLDGEQDGDHTCLEMLQDDLATGQVFLLLFLCEAGFPWKVMFWRFRHIIRSIHRRQAFPLQVPKGYLPRPFRVVDACVTNASGVWLKKHFYL